MTDLQHKPDQTLHWIGKVLAAMLTIAIVVVVFWHTHLGGDGPNTDSPSPQGPEHFQPIFDDMGDNHYRAMVGPAIVEVLGKPATEFNFRLRGFRLMDDDTRMSIRAQQILLQNADAAKAINLTPEQASQLEAINLPRMVIDDTDQQAVVKLWHDWEQADNAHKAAAQDAVFEALRVAGEKGVEPKKNLWVSAGASVRKILTLQQQAKLAVWEDANPQNTMRGPWGFGPTTQRRW